MYSCSSRIYMRWSPQNIIQIRISACIFASNLSIWKWRKYSRNVINIHICIRHTVVQISMNLRFIQNCVQKIRLRILNSDQNTPAIIIYVNTEYFRDSQRLRIHIHVLYVCTFCIFKIVMSVSLYEFKMCSLFVIHIVV